MSVKGKVDIVLALLLLCLISFQLTREKVHEWIALATVIFVIIHQILNRRWYFSLLKGGYNSFRTIILIVDILLILAFLMTALCGMSMSVRAVPFMYGIFPIALAKKLHLALSHWTFIFMGVHIGLHLPAIINKYSFSIILRRIISITFLIFASLGFFFFLRSGIAEYLTVQTHFAFFDYTKHWLQVLLENILIVAFLTSIGVALNLLVVRKKQPEKKRSPLFSLAYIAFVIIIGFGLNLILPEKPRKALIASWGSNGNTLFNDNNFDEKLKFEPLNEKKEIFKGDDFILIKGGSFLMGSPTSENWRIDDEEQHMVTLSPFFIDAYEVRQKEYELLLGENKSHFKGENLPIENISWLDALRFANAKSIASGLEPAYEISKDEVRWNRAANGYRLPTEAEWEYACRAGTLTPFNLEKSLDATEANFYGHYPYEIEENYFNNSSLEAKPGLYRKSSVEVGSFKPNAWGLYDCHGNVSEWCWDYYGKYDLENSKDPIGAKEGKRHIFRGGGWNDFAKNMRSSYRAAAQANYTSFKVGLRLVRNAEAGINETIAIKEVIPENMKNAKVLIAYYSWGGNTKGVALEIKRQTGFDIFEITLTNPYSKDYNTVLMQAQRDQNSQARPSIANKIDNMDEYDIVLLGYPNWWASIPMPIASFLEEYDFSNKRIIPFCSHGGGSLGESMTAIGKLAPKAEIGVALSVHYDGGGSLPSNVDAWLKANHIEK